MLRLKKKLDDVDYPGDTCAAARCEEPATIIDGTGRLAPGRVPLCERHWEARCEMTEPYAPPSRRIPGGQPPQEPPRAEAVHEVAVVRQLQLPFALRR